MYRILVCIFAAVLIIALVLFCSCGKNPQDAAPTQADCENMIRSVKGLYENGKILLDEAKYSNCNDKEERKKAEQCLLKAYYEFGNANAILLELNCDPKYKGLITDEMQRRIEKLHDEIMTEKSILIDLSGSSSLRR